MRWRHAAVAVVLACAGGVGAGADEPAAPTDVSAELGPIRERHDVPGLVAAVVTREGLVLQGAAGVRRRGSPEPIAVTDPMHLGSCTKAMTATLAAMLVEERRLIWDRSVAVAFPDLGKSMHEGWRGATLEQFLAHRGGAPEDLDADGLWERLCRHTGTPEEARRTLLEGVVRRAPAHPPGTVTRYSNAGYAIAGAMAEAATGMPWEDLLRRRLFDPLGMTSAGFGAPGTREKVDAPRGHREDGTPVEPGPGSDNPPAIGPAGTVHASIGDWGKFISLHLRGTRADTPLLPRDQFQKLHTVPEGAEPPYALGWIVTRRQWGGNGDVLTHAGSNTMWYCVAWLAPARGFAVLVACNQGGENASRACDEVASALIARHLEITKGR